MNKHSQHWHTWRERIGFDHLLPIVQSGKPVEGSRITSLEAALKTPSEYTGSRSMTEFRGLSNWATPEKCEVTEARWSKWADNKNLDYGVCVRLGHEIGADAFLAAIDVDTENEEDLQAVCDILDDLKIDGNTRYRSNSDRFLMLVAVPFPGRKVRWKFGDDRWLEFLALGQQCVLAGAHKSGVEIEWDYDDIPFVDAATWGVFCQRMDEVATRGTEDEARGELQGYLPEDLEGDLVAQWLINEAGWQVGAKGVYGFTHWNTDQTGGEALYKLAAGGHAPEFVLMHNREKAGIEGMDDRQAFIAVLEGQDIDPGEMFELLAWYDEKAASSRRSNRYQPQASDEAREKARNCFTRKATAVVAWVADVKPDAAPRRPRAEKRGAASGKWDGMCGDYRDALREKVAALTNHQLWQIPPDVKPVLNRDGDIVGFKPLNTGDNFAWMVNAKQWKLARNVMTWAVEAFNNSGKRLTTSDAQTRSLVISEMSRRDIPRDGYGDHFDAVAENNSYHPVAELLSGRKWDGKARVLDALNCVNALRPEYAERLLLAVMVAAIAAIDDGRVEMKACPVLYSKQNDWRKSQFVSRFFDVLPGAFKGGLTVDPASKDSVRKAVFCWGGELGELDAMSKVDSARLKAWIPLDEDEWRTEHKAFMSQKPRQTVFIGTVNKDDFIKDDSLATRFPVIELAGPTDIDTLNQILGWTYDGNTAKLTDPDQLIQFWLEVRELYKGGASYIIDGELMQEVRDTGDRFTDKGAFYQAVVDKQAQHGDENVDHQWQTATQVAQTIGATAKDNRLVGKALQQRWLEQEIDRKLLNGSKWYWFPVR